MKKIKNMDSGLLLGLMDSRMLENGKKEGNMA